MGSETNVFDLIGLNLLKIFLLQTQTYLILFGVPLYLDSEGRKGNCLLSVSDSLQELLFYKHCKSAVNVGNKEMLCCIFIFTYKIILL